MGQYIGTTDSCNKEGGGLYCQLLKAGLSHFSQMALGSWGRSNLNHHSYIPNEYKGRAHSPHIAQSQRIRQLKTIPSHWVCLGMQHRTRWGWQLSAASGRPAGWLYSQRASVVPRSTSAEGSKQPSHPAPSSNAWAGQLGREGQ